MADGTVDIAGKKIKKNTAVAGAAVILLVIGIAVYRTKKARASPPAAAAAGSYPPDGTTGNPADLYSTDPATGQTYGDEQAMGGTGGYSAGTDAQGYPLGSPADLAWQNSLGTGGFINYPVTAVTAPGQTFTTNGQWAQYVEQYMTQTLGANPETIGNALGKYITGQPVTAAQQSLIEQAIAFAGSPPVAGPNGMPPSINLAAPKPPTATKIKVPSVTGKKYPAAAAELQAHHLRARRHPGEKAVNTVISQDPAAGAEVTEGTTVTLTGEATG